MSQHTTEVPEVAHKTGNMFCHWASKMRVGALLLGLGLYIYFLLFIKTVYMKSKRLDRIMAMAMQTEKIMQNVHTIDQNLAVKMERLDELYEDY